MKERTHYNIDRINKEGATINLIWGEKANGKSYQVKHKMAILPYLFGGVRYHADYKDKTNIVEECIKKGTRFILMRRLREEIKTEFVEQYFMDVDIASITEGKYNCITLYRKHIYLSNYDMETGKVVRGEHIGYAVALSTEQNYAGGSYLDVTDIIFEEFASRTVFLPNESNKLMTFYSTVDRRRGVVRLWLVGNTISRVCPYIQDWGLNEIMFNLKQGQIKTIWIPTGQLDEDGDMIEVKLALEYCANVSGSNFAIGTHADSTNKGAWQSDPQPKLPKSYKNYERLFEVIFLYKGFKFMAHYLMDKETNDLLWFIYPYTREIKKDVLVFSDIVNSSPYWQRDIYNPSINNMRIRELLGTFKENKIFYASDLCGTEFKSSIDFEIRK